MTLFYFSNNTFDSNTRGRGIFSSTSSFHKPKRAYFTKNKPETSDTTKNCEIDLFDVFFFPLSEFNSNQRRRLRQKCKSDGKNNYLLVEKKKYLCREKKILCKT